MLETRVSPDGQYCLGPREPSTPWEEFLRSHPDAWNGPLMQLIEADETKLVACASNYQAFVEARARSSSSSKVFLAVTGVLFNAAGFIIGRRSVKVNRPGAWEFAPAGGLETFPIEDQLCSEILEELNIGRTELRVGTAVGLYVDCNEHIADVVIPVRVLTSLSDVLMNFQPGEYEKLEVASISSLRELAHEENAVDDLFRCIVGWIDLGIIGRRLSGDACAFTSGTSEKG